MANIPIYDSTGKEVGSYQIEPTDLAKRINRQLLHDAVVMYQANQRHGASKTKSRAEVAGSTAKMYRQKGTGHARAGSRRSGIRRGGGHIMALRPRDYSYRMPRKALQAATRMAVAAKIRDNELVIIDQLSIDEPRTRVIAGLLKALQLHETSVLVAIESHDENIWKSARNIPNIQVTPVADLNALSVLTPRRLLMTKAALDWMKQRSTTQTAEQATPA